MRRLVLVLVVGGVSTVAACGGVERDPSAHDAGGTTGSTAGPAGAGGNGTGAAGATGGMGASSSGPGGGAAAGGGPSIAEVEAACVAASAELCAKDGECMGFVIDYVYGGVEVCSKQTVSTCINEHVATGTSGTLDQLSTCVAEYSALSCDELLGPDLAKLAPSCQAAPGPKENGESCYTDAQCKTGFCPMGLCGQCSDRTPLGGQCQLWSPYCEVGLMCSQAGSCAVPGVLGDPCGLDKPCAWSVTCLGGVCSTPPSVGTPCQMMDDCWFIGGLYCDPNSQTCQKFLFAQGGEPCGDLPQGSTLCAGYGTCNGSPSGTCIPASPVGGPCNPGEPGGIFCLPPAGCSGETCETATPEVCE